MIKHGQSWHYPDTILTLSWRFPLIIPDHPWKLTRECTADRSWPCQAATQPSWRWTPRGSLSAGPPRSLKVDPSWWSMEDMVGRDGGVPMVTRVVSPWCPHGPLPGGKLKVPPPRSGRWLSYVPQRLPRPPRPRQWTGRGTPGQALYQSCNHPRSP